MPIAAKHVPGLWCLECRSAAFEVLNDGDLTLFRCVVCRRCWHVELGYVSLLPAAATDGLAAGN